MVIVKPIMLTSMLAAQMLGVIGGRGADAKGLGFPSTIRVEVGEPAHTILQVASELDVDLIIMSTHGRSGVSRWLFGSVTGRVLSMAPRPVLIVPSHQQQQKFEREIAELNFS